MKYRDLITAAVVVAFFLSLGYSWGVANSLVFWIIPAFFFILFVVVIYKLWL